MVDYFELHTEDSGIQLTVWADQLLYSLSLIKLCLACVKQNAAVKTGINACSLLAK